MMQAATTAPRVHRVHWWKEVALMVAFYGVYSWIRNQFGSNRLAAEGIPRAAFRNAEAVIGWEKALGLYVEGAIQQAFLPWTWFIQFWNAFYGIAHFVVTLAVFAIVFWRRPAEFPLWRNALAAMTALAIVGFALFPLMPPRLLDEPCPWEGAGNWGGACIASDLRPEAGFGFVDTLAVYGGPWTFESDAMATISNQYAAMPSLHIGWSVWCVAAMWPLVRRRWLRALMLLYPLATLFCIIVTGNHFWLDGVGGLIVVGLGWAIGSATYSWNERRLDRAALATADGATTATTATTDDTGASGTTVDDPTTVPVGATLIGRSAIGESTIRTSDSHRRR